MSDQRFYATTFAQAGDKTNVPDAIDAGGAVSYTEGYGPDYEIDPASPGARRIERGKMNDLFNDITDNLRQYQLAGYPEWVTAAQNGGSPVAYPINAYVRYTATPGVPGSWKVYRSTVTPNTSTPGTNTDWVEVGGVVDASPTVKGVVQLATNAEAIAGANNAKAIVPSSLAAALAASTVDASPTVKGVVQLATNAEAIAGANNAKAIVPSSLAAALMSALVDASTSTKGIVQLATNAEAIAGSNTAKAIVPSSLAAALASYFANAATAAKNTNNAQVATTAYAMAVGLKFSGPIANLSAPVTLTAAQAGNLILSNAGTVTLPALSTMPDGGVIMVQANAGGTLTVAAQGGDVISNYVTPVSSVALSQGQTVWLGARKTSNDWVIIGRFAA